MALFKQYDEFLLNNASQITAVESSLRSITYFLPGRFKDAELAGEAIYSALNLLGLHHDSILTRALEKQDPHAHARATGREIEPYSALEKSPPGAAGGASSSLLLNPSEHTRYTQHFSRTSKAYNHVARTLVIIGYLELLAEMVARRKLGRRRAWDVVASIEAIKVVLRLSLVRIAGDRMTVQPPIPEREVDPAALEHERTKTIGDLAEKIDGAAQRLRDAVDQDDAASTPKGFWKGSRTGFLRPTLASLRPGVDPDPAVQPIEPPPAPEVDRRPPHLRALQYNAAAGAANSGSDSDDTLVDSTRLTGSTVLSQSTMGGSSTPRKPLPSPPVTMKPWTESQINDYLLSRVLSVNDIRKPEELVRPLKGGMGKLAEALWILRPLIYVLAIRRWGRRATLPFLLSFALEYLAKDLRQRSLSSGVAANSSNPFASNPMLAAMMGSNPMTSLLASAFLGSSSPAEKLKRPISKVEESEWSRRSNSFWWYLLRGPAWYGWTRPKLSGLIQRTQGRFLVGVVGGILGDYLPLIDEYYYYSAT
ncbi:peroxisome membrane protein [Testicularia cyperi]|uniref:Peroxisomal membrane protein PEX16 n=1 Tax=Testicularia cyperi TaxID=1882483 RepID=A0A317XNI7_9BASI|nr:peroxisome membrane protein [Testicularia cyperi]